MGVPGWISIRNLPIVKPKRKTTSEGELLFRILAKFFDDNRICKKCGGAGFTITKKRKTKATTMVKFRGIPEIEELKESGKVSVSDVIREIVSRRLEGWKLCNKCNGSRFTQKKS